ncbi:MAG: isochorismate synthase [Gemmatimonadales bacterium]|nr:MAG: isochorismate synthase [Gemmatimonadales bacterium]
MAKAKAVGIPSGVEKRLVSVSVPIKDVEPAVLLRLGKGGPRGFWAREGRWFAHFGSAATVEVDSAADGPDRFAKVWAEARTIFSCSWKDPQSRVNPPSPRLFGGFSFHSDHVAEEPWEHFPSALFVLPKIELVGGDENGVLTLRRLHVPSANPAQCRQELRDELASVRDRLTTAPPEVHPSDVCIPATRSETELESWTTMVNRALAEVSDGVLSNVVMARVQTASFEGVIDPVDVALNLWRENPGSHVFLFEPAPGHSLLGAAPETVATVQGGFFRATAVAGSVARGNTPEEQKSLARQLLKSEKDRREHQVCVEDMVARLAEISQDIQAQPEPHVLTLSAIQHLETAITAELHPDETVLSALEALHPTPAVCGFPRDRAMEFLQAAEAFRRGWYAGPVGWFDSDGNGVFVPALRSAVGRGKEWRLFAGAGIVAGSDASREWAETRIKFRPVLKALSGARAEPYSEDEEAQGS